MESSATRKSCRTFKATIGPFELNFNPVVTLVSAAVIWGFVIWGIVDTDEASDDLGKAKRWITDKFTWLYIGTQDVWFLFIIVVYFSKYSKIKLGKDDDEPEFSDAAYFTMLFSAGIAIGLFYYGVAEPVYHYQPKNPYGNRYWERYDIHFFYVSIYVRVLRVCSAVPTAIYLKGLFKTRMFAIFNTDLHQHSWLGRTTFCKLSCHLHGDSKGKSEISCSELIIVPSPST